MNWRCLIDFEFETTVNIITAWNIGTVKNIYLLKLNARLSAGFKAGHVLSTVATW